MSRIISFFIICCLFFPTIALADGGGDWSDWDDDYDVGYATSLLGAIQIGQSVCVVMGIADADLSNSTGSSDDDWDDDYDDDTNDDDVNYNCEYQDALTWVTDQCVTFYDENDNPMSLEEVLTRCDACLGECASMYMYNCNEAVRCMMDNCEFEAKKQARPSWYDAGMGKADNPFTLYRWNASQSKELFTNEQVYNTNAKSVAAVTDHRETVGEIYVYSDLCVPEGKTIYSLKNEATSGAHSAPVMVQAKEGTCKDPSSICSSLNLSDYATGNGLEKKYLDEDENNSACGCDISEKNTGLSLTVIMTLVGLFAFGLSLRD